MSPDLAYDIRTLKAKGFKPSQVAAITGVPYHEVEAMWSVRPIARSSILTLTDAEPMVG